MLAHARALIIVLSRLAAANAASSAGHRPKVGINLGLLVAACDAAAITRPLDARGSAIGTELEAFVAARSEANAIALNFVGVLADELIELFEVAEHELDLPERPFDLVVLVEILAELLLHAEAAVSVAPVDLATAFAAFRFLLLDAVLAVAAERGVRCKVRRGTHLAFVVVLATIAEEILVFDPDRIHAVIIENGMSAFGNCLGNPWTLRLIPVVLRSLVFLFLFAAVGIFQCHADRIVDAIDRVVAEDRTEGFFQVIDRKLRRLVRRGRLHERRTIVIHCRVHIFLASSPQLNP